jgi:hypothetical protein
MDGRGGGGEEEEVVVVVMAMTLGQDKARTHTGISFEDVGSMQDEGKMKACRN